MMCVEMQTRTEADAEADAVDTDTYSIKLRGFEEAGEQMGR